MFEKMRSEGIAPNRVAFKVIRHACGINKWDKGAFIKEVTYSLIEVIARKCDLNCFR
eukprot:Pgem_evm1s6510